MKTLCLVIALGLSVAALTIVEAQRARPLTLTQIEQLLDNRTPDVVIAREVSNRGLAFTPTAELVERLRQRGAGAQTIQALSALLSKPTPTPTPRPTPTPTPTPPTIEMVDIEGGSFMMGSPNGEGENNEHPQHRVTVRSFAIGKYEVTQAQWRAVMGNNPSRFVGDNLPVNYVSWDEAKEFCRKLSRMTGNNYRLPTEAEWEYACRAGTTGNYAGELDVLAWYNDNSPGGKPHPVGQKKPNAWGLYDMHGNVWEYCEDDWHGDYNSAPTNGRAWMSPRGGTYKVLRGGGSGFSAFNCRSASRYNDAEGHTNIGGLRLVME